ncbi:hypothetical protein GCM10007301_46600 [Azorhizobium oxalatiphilum]|uniref:Uncharacterized protein n=1 Tax=Azorhizobium oxalatiphilum TaxID=980631 RepID=A0A917CBA6_9HYPH|nr:hypothetical protein GCM10007301_46600 [Azorhizobium oxalatiphilum]
MKDVDAMDRQRTAMPMRFAPSRTRAAARPRVTFSRPDAGRISGRWSASFRACLPSRRSGVPSPMARQSPSPACGEGLGKGHNGPSRMGPLTMTAL